MKLASTTSAESSVSGYNLSPKTSFKTEIPSDKVESSFKTNAKPRTWVPEEDAIQGKPFKFTPSLATAQRPSATLPSGKMQANGAVKTIEESFVVCEIYTKSKNVEVRLPKDLFPTSELFFGMPITLALSDQGGYRTPEITIRNVAPESDETNRAIDAMIKDLGN